MSRRARIHGEVSIISTGYPCMNVAGEGAGVRAWLTLAVACMLAGCATRPVNPPITQADASTGYRFEVRQAQVKNKDNLVILAFSGGGTRAAAFSYGVLEFLRRTEIDRTEGQQGPPARRSRRHHRRVRRELHRAGVRPVRREAVRRVRAALPEARCAGRDHRRALQPGLLGRSSVRRAGGVPSWRPSCTTKSCSMAPRSATSTAAAAR